MFELQVRRFRFLAEATSTVRLPPAAGAALRGALFSTLRSQYCLAARPEDCGRSALASECPVCWLLAPVEAGNPRGQDVPRPYVLQLPGGAALTYAPGQSLEFTLTVFGQATDAFPYALLGVQEMGQRGIGQGRQGSFRVTEVWAENSLAGQQERVFRATDGVVRTPSVVIGAADVVAEATRMLARDSDHDQASAPPRLRLILVAPLRLVEGGRLVKPADFRPRVLFARLLDRLDALGERYGSGPTGVDTVGLLTQADMLRTEEQQLRWQDLFRGSGRHRASLPMGGLRGDVVLVGDLAPLLPWLIWATLVHVGKDASMGNGALRVEVARGDGS